MKADTLARRYELLFGQLAELLEDAPNAIASMATIVAVLHHEMDHFFWTGFYLLDQGRLVVGPYQGSLACIELAPGTGVCWAGIDRGATVIVPDVDSTGLDSFDRVDQDWLERILSLIAPAASR
jgi:GAF domain-containing protein